MSARRNRKPPEETDVDVINKTGSKKTGEEKNNGEEKHSYTVTDRRHWVNGDDEQEANEAPQLKPSFVQALEEELKKKDETLREYISQHKAAKTQMNEAIQRIEREKAREVNFRIAELARAFLSIIDDLDAASGAAQKSGTCTSYVSPIFDIVKGLNLIGQRITSTLQSIGITEVEALGKPLDPAIHEAVAVQAVTDPEKDGIIIEVLKKGYKLGDVLVRPGAVVVGKLETQ